MVETLEMVDMIGKKTTDGERNNNSSHKKQQLTNILTSHCAFMLNKQYMCGYF